MLGILCKKILIDKDSVVLELSRKNKKNIFSEKLAVQCNEIKSLDEQISSTLILHCLHKICETDGTKRINKHSSHFLDEILRTVARGGITQFHLQTQFWLWYENSPSKRNGRMNELGNWWHLLNFIFYHFRNKQNIPACHDCMQFFFHINQILLINCRYTNQFDKQKQNRGCWWCQKICHSKWGCKIVCCRSNLANVEFP